MRIVDPASLDLAAVLPKGAAIVCGQACAEPLTLLEMLIAQRAALGGASLFVGASFSGVLKPEHTDHLRINSFGALGTNRALAKANVLGLIPCHVARLGPYFTAGTLPCDVLFVQVSPADSHGRYSFGVTADYIRDAARAASLVIAEINDQAPRTLGHDGLTDADIDIAVPVSRPLPAVPAAAPAATDEAIAAHAAAYIGDDAILQIGIGATPEAILRRLTDRRNLGFHSGMMSDGVMKLIACGALTDATKPIDRGIAVTGALIGTPDLYRFAHDNPRLALRGADYTHGDATLAQLGRLVTINSAIEVDLTGQINAEMAGSDYVGGIGGQADFVRAGHRAAQGCAIIALPATARGASRIVPALSTVSTARTDADVIVTEFGAASLRGCTLAERARRMIAIAHPDFRAGLEEKALFF